MKTQWGVKHERRDCLDDHFCDHNPTWTSTVAEFDTRHEARIYADRLTDSPEIWRNVQLVRREVTAWWDAK